MQALQLLQGSRRTLPMRTFFMMSLAAAIAFFVVGETLSPLQVVGALAVVISNK